MGTVEVKTGNLLNSGAHTLVNTVNCVGVMGKGIALDFKKRFPEMFDDYVARCRRGEVRLGEPYLFRHLIGPWVLNFPTKDHWRDVANIRDIELGLDYLASHIKEWDIKSIAVPHWGVAMVSLNGASSAPHSIATLQVLVSRLSFRTLQHPV
jgi:O-acetyl-ADP-ribose deacetylase (regulator of RNase III)